MNSAFVRRLASPSRSRCRYTVLFNSRFSELVYWLYPFLVENSGRRPQGVTKAQHNALPICWLGLLHWKNMSKHCSGWFVMREKYCFGWKNKLKSMDYKRSEHGRYHHVGLFNSVNPFSMRIWGLTRRWTNNYHLNTNNILKYKNNKCTQQGIIYIIY